MFLVLRKKKGMTKPKVHSNAVKRNHKCLELSNYEGIKQKKPCITAGLF